MQSDGCTWAPDSAFGFDWSLCCVLHDYGLSDALFTDCLDAVIPGLGLIGGLLLFLIRPIYRLWKRVKHAVSRVHRRVRRVFGGSRSGPDL